MDITIVTGLDLLAFLMIIRIACFVFTFLRFMLRHLLPCQNLIQKYGAKKDNWAVVTGATDGIGKGFCQNLAEMGWNVCLISRNAQKIQKVIEQLKKINRNVLYEGVVADFKNSQSDQNFFKKIKQRLSRLNIGILVNNVGQADVTKFHQISEQQHMDRININCVPQAILSRIVIQSMLKRNQRSAIVNLSSYSATNPLPFISLYSGTKGFNDALSRALAEEYSEKIDVLSALPMEVQSGTYKKQRSFRIATSKECALGCLKDLGYSKRSYGYITHTFIHFMLQCLPQFIVHGISTRQAKRVYEQLRENTNKKE